MSERARLTLGTAGHIDHGKTRLVEALTGTDTDRLPEEKRRGISIALGYADLALPSGMHLSVIDVPGHERFVRTMLAGATGIDLFLLVVDAGEGPKPQTLEHLTILRLLGVDNGVVALTKIDAVDEERRRASEAAVAELLPGISIVPVSALDGRGIPALVAALDAVAAQVPQRAASGPARLYVDRSFSLPGVGAVVTGTLWAGAVSTGDRLDVLPAGYQARVRSIEVHGESVDRAEAGRRVALAVSTERRRRLAPGDALVAPGAFVLAYRLDVVLDGEVAIPAGAHVTVCHGTSGVRARVVRAGKRFAQLRLERPLVAARGDRFVLRGETTLGGGRVLDPNPPRRLDEDRFARLERGDLGGLIDAPVSVEELRVRLGLGADDLAGVSSEIVRAGDWVCSRHWLDLARARVEADLVARDGEVDPGLLVSASFGQEPWTAEIAGLLGLDIHEGKLYLPGRRPSSGERAAAIPTDAGAEPFGIDDAALARQLEREGRLVQLRDGLALSPEGYAVHMATLVAECERTGTISLARFRDLSGLSRRIAQLVLERFDADRVTLRVGDERRLRRGAR
ncbi:MAG TPA: selenocysteine-specific translation elongation factor [Gaiellaceae bacterium]|jgi:selenocysteine-specific elongation factor